MKNPTPELVELVTDLTENAAQPAAGNLPDLWPTMIELGLTTVGIPEHLGGTGGTVCDLITLQRGFSASGFSTPLGTYSVANWVLGLTGESLGGTTIAGNAEPTGDVLYLSAVPWARHSERLLVIGGEDVEMVDLRHPEVSIAPGVNLCGDARDDVVAPRESRRTLPSSPMVSEIMGRIALLGAAALTGAMDGAYRLAREQVRTREQFGKPLIDIPSVAANLSQLKVAVLESDAALDRAVDSHSESVAMISRTPYLSAVTARLMAATAGTRAARIAHQVHGALGITQEYPLHLFTTRIWAWRDEPIAEGLWAQMLGDCAISGGETALWDSLTS